MLSIDNLHKAFGTHVVLGDTSLQVASGSILGLVGPNGAGKSTLLRCVLGLLTPDRGSITVDGVDAVADSIAARRRMAYAPSETALYHRMTAAGLVRFALAFHGAPDVSGALALLNAFQVPAKARLRHLSHGMKRKVLLAQALSTGAGLIVLDEPMEALDPEARLQVESLLRQRAAAGAAVLFSSHDLMSTQRLCDFVAFLHHGRIVRQGTADELLAEASRVLHLRLREPRTLDALPAHDMWTWNGSGVNWTVSCAGPMEPLLAALSTLPVAAVRGGGSLEELFATLYSEAPAC